MEVEAETSFLQIINPPAASSLQLNPYLIQVLTCVKSTCTSRQLELTNKFKAFKVFSGQVPLMMLFTFLLKMIMCKQYAGESCALHCHRLHN